MRLKYITTAKFQNSKTLKTTIQVALLSIVLIGIGIVFMCVRILLKQGGRFHAKHIGQSHEMRRRGIHCVQSMDTIERAEYQKRQKQLHNYSEI